MDRVPPFAMKNVRVMVLSAGVTVTASGVAYATTSLAQLLNTPWSALSRTALNPRELVEWATRCGVVGYGSARTHRCRHRNKRNRTHKHTYVDSWNPPANPSLTFHPDRGRSHIALLDSCAPWVANWEYPAIYACVT